MREATFALAILCLVIAILCAFHTSSEPSPVAIKASAPACVFEKHPIKPLWRIA